MRPAVLLVKRRAVLAALVVPDPRRIAGWIRRRVTPGARQMCQRFWRDVSPGSDCLPAEAYPCTGALCDAGSCTYTSVACIPGNVCCGNGECCPDGEADPSLDVTSDDAGHLRERIESASSHQEALHGCRTL